MASFHFIVISLALLVSLTNATWWGRGRTTLPAGAQLGDTCTPRGSPRRCGDRTLLSSTSRELNATDGFQGPNVCRVTSMYMQQTYGYTYQQDCYNFYFRRYCQTGCYQTDSCNGTMVNFTKTSTECCDGFAQEESMDSSLRHHFSFFRKRKSSLRTQGCTIMLRNSVLDCLGELNLGEFLAQILQVPNIQGRLGSADSDEVTVFAPSNEAIANLDDITRGLLFGDATRETSVSAHIGDGSFTAKSLYHGDFIDTLASNVTVHIGRTNNGTVKQYFVNGVRISQTNACLARNGVVHVVDDVLPFSSATIDDILIDQSSRFSTFQNLAKEAGLAEALDAPMKSRTLFAPVNEAFSDAQRLVECLLEEDNRWKLNEFVLIHIAYPAEYTSTLSECDFVPSFSNLYHGLSISSSNGQVNVTKDQIPVIDADIPARNGVVHAISQFIQPFSDRKLERFCPGVTAPATTAPPTTPVVVDPEATADPDGVPPGGSIIDPESIEK